jgi:hypothetical protein
MEKSAGDVRRVAVLQEGVPSENPLSWSLSRNRRPVRTVEPCVFLTLKRAKFLCLRQRDPE